VLSASATFNNAIIETAAAWLHRKWYAADGLRYNRIGDCF
jgi:hypothetical protein